MSEAPSGLQVLRETLAGVTVLAGVHLCLALVFSPMGEFALLVPFATKPLWGLLVFAVGTELEAAGDRRRGTGLKALALLHLASIVVLPLTLGIADFFVVLPDPRFVVLLLLERLVFGALWVALLLGSAAQARSGKGRLIAALPSLVAVAFGVTAWWLTDQTRAPGGIEPTTLLLLGEALVLLPLAIARRALRQSPHVQELVRALHSLPGPELLDDRVPIRVRYRVPCQVPYGLRVSSPGQGVTLHNPVLDQLLELSTPAPAAVSSMFSENEDTVLALLHRFPDSRLEADAVVFEATAAQLAESGDTQQALDEGVQAAESLAALLEGRD